MKDFLFFSIAAPWQMFLFTLYYNSKPINMHGFFSENANLAHASGKDGLFSLFFA